MRLGEVWPGKAEQGLAGLGEATVADGSTEDLGPLCCSLRRVDEVGSACVRSGAARQGRFRRGNSCRQQHGGLMLSLLLFSESRQGTA
jgi:hypothetical protein